jgi:antitoxin component of MazEF toxin-antitoxin module
MVLYSSSRKIQEFGSSHALTIPSLFIKVRDLKKGNELRVLCCLDGVLIVSDIDNLNNMNKVLKKMINNIEENKISP